MKLEELGDDDLRDVIRLGCRAIAEGHGVTEAIRRYGIRDEEDLEQWISAAELELRRRDLDI